MLFNHSFEIVGLIFILCLNAVLTLFFFFSVSQKKSGFKFKKLFTYDYWANRCLNDRTEFRTLYREDDFEYNKYVRSENKCFFWKNRLIVRCATIVLITLGLFITAYFIYSTLNNILREESGNALLQEPSKPNVQMKETDSTAIETKSQDQVISANSFIAETDSVSSQSQSIGFL